MLISIIHMKSLELALLGIISINLFAHSASAAGTTETSTVPSGHGVFIAVGPTAPFLQTGYVHWWKYVGIVAGLGFTYTEAEGVNNTAASSAQFSALGHNNGVVKIWALKYRAEIRTGFTRKRTRLSLGAGIAPEMTKNQTLQMDGFNPLVNLGAEFRIADRLTLGIVPIEYVFSSSASMQVLGIPFGELVRQQQIRVFSQAMLTYYW